MTNAFAPLVILGGLNYGVQKTLTLQPDEASGLDTEITAFSPTFNYGVADELAVGKIVLNYRSMIAFDISALPAGCKIDSSVLTLYCNSTLGPPMIINPHRALTQWFEGDKDGADPDPGQDGSTWNLRNANGAAAWAGGAGGAAGDDWETVATAGTLVNGAGYFTWDVLVDIRLWAAGIELNYGWWLLNDADLNNALATFSSSSIATASWRPKLEVVYRELIP